MIGKTAADRSAYAASGVDVAAGDRAVELMRASVASTMRPEVLGGLGGFGAAFTIPVGYREPVIVSSTDGVGTKTAIAAVMGRLDTIGIDLVAMCADDVVCSGAEPVAFLDYIAIGRLVPERVASLVAGIAEGCRQAGAALVGGETAEHPGLMDPDEFDLAGFCTGVGERSRLLDGTAARAGDAIVGLAASGLHSNGYSLARKVFFEAAGLKIGDAVQELGMTAADALLTPTRIYVKNVLALMQDFSIKGMAHITGGGITENLPRAFPEGCRARIDKSSWNPLPLFGFIQKRGNVDEDEMFRDFNMGIGLVAVIGADEADGFIKAAEGLGEKVSLIGEIIEGGKGVEYVG